MRRARPAICGALVLIATACGSAASDDAGSPSVTSAPANTTSAAAPIQPSTPEATSETMPELPDVETTTARSTLPLTEVPEALQFTAPLVGGGDLNAASLAGPPVVMWFWAPF